MLIVNRKEFLELPPGTLYAKYSTSWSFGDLAIKEDTMGSDWWYVDILGWPQGCHSSNDLFDNIAKYEKEWRFEFESSARDGFYDQDQLFAVYDKEDINQLINKLKELSQ